MLDYVLGQTHEISHMFERFADWLLETRSGIACTWVVSALIAFGVVASLAQVFYVAIN